MPAKPRIIIIHVEASGADGVTSCKLPTEKLSKPNWSVVLLLLKEIDMY